MVCSQQGRSEWDRAPLPICVALRESTEPGRRLRLTNVTNVDSASVTLAHYLPGTQDDHTHSYHQLSFLLAGELREGTHRSEFDVNVPSIGFKHAGERHRNEWGPGGALIFSVRFPEAPPATGFTGVSGWRVLKQVRELQSLLRLCLTAGDERIVREAVADILALSGEAQEPPSRPPLWLRCVKMSLSDASEELCIEAAAEKAGVHRVHLSRLFKYYYGVPPSIYRRRCLTARAISDAIWQDDRLTHVAHDAGFFDQSHAARSVKHETGLTLGELRAHLGGRNRMSSPHNPTHQPSR